MNDFNNLLFYVDEYGGVECSVTYKDGTKQVIDVQYHDLLNILGVSTELKHVETWSRVKCSNLIDLSLRDDSNFISAVYFPSRRLPFTYFRANSDISKEMLIEYPPSIMIFKVIEGKLTSSYLGCLKSKLDGNEVQKVYQFPFSNINKSGSICWGSVQLPTNLTASSIDYDFLYCTLLSSVFTGHYTEGRLVDPVAAAMMCQEQFNPEVLCETINNEDITLDDFIECHLSKEEYDYE